MECLIKLRPLFVSQIIYDNTDENHYITIVEIISILKEKYGVEAYRTTVKSDIDMLIKAGFNVEFVKSSQNKYHVVGREFDLAELKILIDAVASSKFISKGKSESLSKKLSDLAGPFESSNLKRNIDVERRIKSDNNEILDIVDTINIAINQKKKVVFQYFSYNIRKEKKLRHNGKEYIFSPYKLVWNGDYYYVIGFSEKYQSIGNFRIDRISKQPDIIEEHAVEPPTNFDFNEYINNTFRMYNGNCEEVELVCDNSVIDSIIDRFGENVKILANDMDSFRIIVYIKTNHIFYSWIFGFCGKVKIKSPDSVKQHYAKMIQETIKVIED